MSPSIISIFELDQLARQDVAQYKRERSIVAQLSDETGKHMSGILGPRGAGKTIALQQLSMHLQNSLYVSADTVEQGGLFECVRQLSAKYGIKSVCIDEIHFQKNFDQALKKIYDFLDIKVFFTSSVALALHEMSVDLARRVKLFTLYPFSFREFILFKTGSNLPRLTFEDILAKRWSSEHMRQEHLFDEYLGGGLMPFSLQEPDIIPLMHNIAKKVVLRDIPYVRSIAWFLPHSELYLPVRPSVHCLLPSARTTPEAFPTGYR